MLSNPTIEKVSQGTVYGLLHYNSYFRVYLLRLGLIWCCQPLTRLSYNKDIYYITQNLLGEVVQIVNFGPNITVANPSPCRAKKYHIDGMRICFDIYHFLLQLQKREDTKGTLV